MSFETQFERELKASAVKEAVKESRKAVKALSLKYKDSDVVTDALAAEITDIHRTTLHRWRKEGLSDTATIGEIRKHQLLSIKASKIRRKLKKEPYFLVLSREDIVQMYYDQKIKEITLDAILSWHEAQEKKEEK